MNLKCVCGYAHEDKFCRDANYAGGEEDFLEVRGQFSILQRYEDERYVKLYSCPKCNTIQMSKY